VTATLPKVARPLTGWRCWTVRIGNLVAMTIAGILLFRASDTTTVAPPPRPIDPVTVILGQYGKHSSLFLPLPAGGMEEFANGDFDYFALNRDNWFGAMRALFFSRGSSLATRTLPIQPDDPTALAQLDAPDSLVFRVSRAKADALRQSLEAEFNRHRDTLVYNAENRLYNVRCDGHYSLGSNCNNVSAQWLRALGCRVRGPAMTTDFELATP
jgi:hypothetical protein